jgi:hypothetical protein
MKLFTSIILGGVLQVLAVSASSAEYINPDTANNFQLFFWYLDNGGLHVALTQTAANLGFYGLATMIAAF